MIRRCCNNIKRVPPVIRPGFTDIRCGDCTVWQSFVLARDWRTLRVTFARIKPCVGCDALHPQCVLSYAFARGFDRPAKSGSGLED